MAVIGQGFLAWMCAVFYLALFSQNPPKSSSTPNVITLSVCYGLGKSCSNMKAIHGNLPLPDQNLCRRNKKKSKKKSLGRKHKTSHPRTGYILINPTVLFRRWCMCKWIRNMVSHGIRRVEMLRKCILWYNNLIFQELPYTRLLGPSVHFLTVRL